MKPAAMKNAVTTSQTVPLPKPLSASVKVSVRVARVAAMPTRAIAPMGSGLAVTPAMVATKMANSLQVRASTASGRGSAQINRPTPTTSASRQGRAPDGSLPGH